MSSKNFRENKREAPVDDNSNPYPSARHKAYHCDHSPAPPTATTIQEAPPPILNTTTMRDHSNTSSSSTRPPDPDRRLSVSDSVAEELSNLRKQGLAKSQSGKFRDAGKEHDSNC